MDWLKEARARVKQWLTHIRDCSDAHLESMAEMQTLRKVLRLIPPGRAPKLKSAQDNVMRAVLLLKQLMKHSRSIPDPAEFDEASFWNGPLRAAASHQPSQIDPSLYPGSAVATADAYRVSDKLVDKVAQEDPYLRELGEQIHAVEAVSKKRALDLHELCARYLKAQHRLMEAAQRFGYAAELRAEIKDYSLSTRMMLHQASALYRAHEFQTTIEILEKARAVCLKHRLDTYDLRTYLRILELLGIAYGRVDRFEEGLKYIDLAEKISTESKFEIPWFDATRKSKRGILLMDLDRLDPAIVSMREAAAIRRQEGLKAELARGLNWIALYYLKKVKIPEALALFCVCLPQVHKQNPVEEMNVKFHRLHALRAWLQQHTRTVARTSAHLKMAEIIEQMDDSEEKTSALFLMKDHKPDPREIRIEEVSSMMEKDIKDVLETEMKMGIKRTFAEQLGKWN